MRPGFYIVVRDTVLDTPEKASYKARLKKGDWLVTDGYNLGKFDKNELDWAPLEWVRGAPVLLDDSQVSRVELVTAPIQFSRLETSWAELLAVEPGEPTPDMPRPSLAQLEGYFRGRHLTAYHPR